MQSKSGDCDRQLDNQKVTKGPRKGNREPVRGADGRVSGKEDPFHSCSLLIAPVPLTVLTVEVGMDV